VGLAKGADDFGGVAVLAVDGLVHGAHVVGGDASGESVEGELDLRPAAEGFVADEWNGLVGREVVPVVVENGEVEGLDGTVCSVGGDHVDLMVIEGAIEEAEIHRSRRASEVEAVGGAETGEAVGALLEFVTDTETHLPGEFCGLAECGDVKALSVVAADDHGEGIVEAEGRGYGDLEALVVEAADGRED
jgi:hypothetical protein